MKVKLHTFTITLPNGNTLPVVACNVNEAISTAKTLDGVVNNMLPILTYFTKESWN